MGSRRVSPNTNTSLSSIAQDSAEKEDKNMLQKLVNIVEYIEKLNEEEPKVSISVNHAHSGIMIYDLKLFHKLSEGYHIEFEERKHNPSKYVRYRAEFEAYGIEFETFLDEGEHERLQELLSNE